MLATKASRHLLFIFGWFFIGVLNGVEEVGFGGGVGALAATGRLAHLFAGARLRCR